MFDLEGTLVHTIENDPKAITEFRARTRQKLLESVPCNVLDGATTFALMYNKALEYEERLGESETNRFRLEMHTFLKRYELSWARRSKIFPDTFSALRKLEELGCKMGIVTNTSREAAACMHAGLR